VWFGLRSSADGKSGAFPVVVFGGDHADVELGDAHEGAKALAGLLATRNVPAVLDVSDMTMGARVRFMTGFLDELYRANRQPLTLVIDEADLFAPQRALPDQTVMLSRMEQIVRRGRVRGFRPWMITQRPAELHKSVLSQANTLIAMQLTAPQDRDAIGAWIEGQADRDEGKKILANLPKLKKGEGWIWSPSHDVLKRAKFPAIKTFDSSRTPEEGEAQAAVALADVDLSEIRKQFAVAREKIAADDPEALRARIAELEARPSEPSIDPLHQEHERAARSKATAPRSRPSCRSSIGCRRCAPRWTSSSAAWSRTSASGGADTRRPAPARRRRSHAPAEPSHAPHSVAHAARAGAAHEWRAVEGRAPRAHRARAIPARPREEPGRRPDRLRRERWRVQQRDQRAAHEGLPRGRCRRAWSLHQAVRRHWGPSRRCRAGARCSTTGFAS
jgi:hypothetical protein